jgi:ribosomal protein S11
MEQPVPRIGSHRNGRIGLRKSALRIPKGVIHVQASFNNTIVTITYVRGWVISWSSTGTCGFKGRRRGTQFAAQTAARNDHKRTLKELKSLFFYKQIILSFEPKKKKKSYHVID